MQANTIEIAKIFNYSVDTITNWKKRGYIKPISDKGNEVLYNISEIHNYIISKEKQKSRKIVSTDEKKLKLRKLQAETLKEELQVEKELGNLMPLDHIRKHIQNVFESLKAGIIQMPAKLCNELANEDDPNVIQAEIEQYCRQLMESIGDQIENYATQDN